MTPEELYECLALPGAAQLDKRIFKKMFHQYGQLTGSDKKALSEDVEKITWKYTLKPNTVQVQPFEDAEREYLEVPLIEVSLSNRKRAARIAEIIQRSIPYPIFLVIHADDALVISVAHKRFSRVEKGAVVAEAPLLSPWITSPLSEVDKIFVRSLSITELSHVDFLALYQDWVTRIVARNCADLSGTFDISSRPEAERRTNLVACREMEREISSLKAAIKRELSFAEKVELNTKIKALETRLRESVKSL